MLLVRKNLPTPQVRFYIFGIGSMDRISDQPQVRLSSKTPHLTE
jgi:hypothetical protein